MRWFRMFRKALWFLSVAVTAPFIFLVAVWCLLAVGLVISNALSVFSPAAQAPTPAPENWNRPAPEPTPAVDPAKRKFTRAERKLAREVIKDAAEAMGESRRTFMQGVSAERNAGYEGPTPHLEELETSLAMHDDAAGFFDDMDEFGQFLEMLLAFIEKLLALFGMFSLDMPTLDAPAVATIPLDVPVVASVPFHSLVA